MNEPKSSGIPESVIARLFVRMESMWGERFHRFWLDCDMTETRKAWREALNGIGTTEVSFRRGVAALIYEAGPPDLPRFIALCRGQTMSNTSTQAALAGPRVITPAAREALDRMKTMLAPLKAKVIVSTPQHTDIELPARVPSPHIYREPGCDDE